MARTIWEHTFKTPGDQDELSEVCIRDKLVQIAALRDAVAAKAGPDSASDITKPTVEACLEVCLRRFEQIEISATNGIARTTTTRPMP